VDLDDITTAIAAGELDGKLDDIVRTVVTRVRAGAVEMVWRARLDGDEWDAKTITLGELLDAQQRAGAVGRDGGLRRDLAPTVNIGDALAIIVAHLHKAKDMPAAEALAKAENIPAGDIAGIIDEYELVGGPLGDSSASPSS